MKKLLVLFAALTLLLPSCMKKKEAQWLFVMHARHAEMTKEELKLSDVDHYVLAFTDRPERKTMMVTSEQFVKEWPKSFDKINPNATISYYDKAGKYRDDAIELIDPKMEGSSVTFKIRALDGVEVVEPHDLGETAVFIDWGYFTSAASAKRFE